MNWIKTENGIELKNTSEILADIQEAFTSAFPNINLSAETPQGQIITYLTSLVTQAQEDIVSLANVFVAGGSNRMLDARNSSIFGLTRKTASKGSVTAIVTGLTGTVIPVGFKASNGEKEFITTSVNVIGMNGNVTISMVAVEDGKFIINSNTLTQIITEINGVESITNPAPSIAGQDTETDSQYRLRAKESVYYNSSALFSGLLARLQQLNGVVKVAGKENTTSQAIQWKNYELQPHSIYPIVKGGDIQEIGDTITKYKNMGCYCGGDVEVNTIDDIARETYIARFSRPTSCELKAEIQIKVGLNAPENYQELIKTQIKTEIDNIAIGSEVYPFQIVNVINIMDIEVVDFKIGKKTGEAGYGVITLNFLEEAILNDENITVTVYGSRSV